MKPNFFKRLAKNMRKLSAGLQEKPHVTIDDYVLEHFLLYNGLIGSSPENQPSFRDVRYDIVKAINDDSPAKLAIALRISPLWWKDRLEKVFGEIAIVNRNGCIAHLLAERSFSDDTVGDSTCLSHTDWQVRANAAAMLAFLDAKEAIPRLIPLLKDVEGAHKNAFCHYAYALATLSSDQARLALVNELSNEEPWFRVDAAGALAHWNLASVSGDLMNATLDGCALDDYMAIAISRKHSISELAEFSDEKIREGVCEMAIAIIRGLNGPLHSEHQAQQQLLAAADRINQLALENPSPRRLHAAISVTEWATELGAPTPKNAIRDLSNPKHYTKVVDTLSARLFTTGAELGQLKHALYLCQRFKLTELTPHLTPLLNRDFPALPELFDCIAELGISNDAPQITEIVKERIDLPSRLLLAMSAHPVVEHNEENALIYWSALKALGSLPHPASLELLSKAVNDYAPDKREQALLSLQKICLSEPLLKAYEGDLEELLKERLNDPAVGVQKAALNGIALHQMAQLVPEVLKSLNSRELSIQRQSSDTICTLAMGKEKTAVKAALEDSLRKEIDASKKARLQKVLDQIH